MHKILPEIFRLNKAHLSQLKMNFNQVHKEVSKDTLIILVLVTVQCANLRLYRCASSSGKSTFSIYLVFVVYSILLVVIASLLEFFVSFCFRSNFDH